MASDSELQKLRSELFWARMTVFYLMPAPVRAVLESYSQCTSLEKLVDWERLTVQGIVQLADARPAEEMGDWPNSTPRALCPLCGASSSWGHVTAFTIPDGLVRHLLGSHRATQCRVFRVMYALANQFVRS